MDNNLWNNLYNQHNLGDIINNLKLHGYKNIHKYMMNNHYRPIHHKYYMELHINNKFFNKKREMIFDIIFFKFLLNFFYKFFYVKNFRNIYLCLTSLYH